MKHLLDPVWRNGKEATPRVRFTQVNLQSVWTGQDGKKPNLYDLRFVEAGLID